MTRLVDQDEKRLIENEFSLRQCFGDEEVLLTKEIIESGHLSSFVGAKGKYFKGGEQVLSCESEFKKIAQSKYAVTVNSWTAGLQTIIGAIGISPGDEVICTSWTMSASATAILLYGGIPVFCDVDPSSYNIDVSQIESLVTMKTKAIMVVHLFGNPADMDPILNLAKKYNLRIIEDAAQSPGALYKSRPVGCIGDIGGFSLNYHKHIHCGEGGVIVTNDKDLYEKCCAIRNHGENIIDDFDDKTNVIGSN